MRPQHNHPQWAKDQAEEYSRKIRADRCRTRLWVGVVLLILIGTFIMGAHGLMVMANG